MVKHGILKNASRSVPKSILKKPRNFFNPSKTYKSKTVKTDGEVYIRTIPRINKPGFVLKSEKSTKYVINVLNNCDTVENIPPLYVLSESSDFWQKITKQKSGWDYCTIKNQFYTERHAITNIENILEQYKKTVNLPYMSTYDSDID